MGLEQTTPPVQPQAEQAAPAQPAGDPAELVQGIHDQMIQLLEMMDRAPGIPPEAKQEFAGIVQNYRSFVSQSLLGEGQQPQAPQGGVGNVAPEAGAAAVQPTA